MLPPIVAAGSSKSAQVEQKSSTPLLLSRRATLPSLTITSNTWSCKVLYSHRGGVILPKVLTKTFAQSLCCQKLFIKSLLIRNYIHSFDGH